jgi:nucleoside-diphosphate-sugar epimerase
MLLQVVLNELDSLKKVDWDGKLYLIEAAKAANIKRFIFFSAQNVNNLKIFH